MTINHELIINKINYNQICILKYLIKNLKINSNQEKINIFPLFSSTSKISKITKEYIFEVYLLLPQELKKNAAK